MNEVVQRKGSDTRDRILDVAEDAILAKGFASTSIEEVIAAVGITKSGFFYHFPDKNELARALLQRFLERDAALQDDLFNRANELHEDPLHGFLVGLKMFAEMMADLPSTHPGCLVASYCYQENLFDRDVRELNRTYAYNWRQRFRVLLDEIAEVYPPKIDVDLDALADMVSSIVEGGITLSKMMRDKSVLPQQVMLYRSFVRTVFLGTEA